MEAKREELFKLLNNNFDLYIVVKTKFTTHHIEKLSHSSDRGRLKWIGETNLEGFVAMPNNEEARRSHIDGGDLFPRLFFRTQSMCDEIFAWLEKRKLLITEIETPQI